MTHRWVRSLALLCVPVLAVALDGAVVDGAAAVEAAPVVFVAHDHGFSGPDRIPPGMTTIQIVNKGQDIHHIQLIKLLQGKTAADFHDALKADAGHLPRWIEHMGGPNAIVPGSLAAAMMNLGQGDYLLICLIPDKNGVPHLALGMQKPLSVAGAMPASVPMPKADLTIKQDDFRYTMSASPVAGAHTVQVMNHGRQPHEVVVVKLAPGATAKDFTAAFEPGASGPPPGIPVGGVVGVEGGHDAFFATEFEAGHYALICFLPDAETGQPHFAKGMTMEFTVK